MPGRSRGTEATLPNWLRAEPTTRLLGEIRVDGSNVCLNDAGDGGHAGGHESAHVRDGGTKAPSGQRHEEEQELHDEASHYFTIGSGNLYG